MMHKGKVLGAMWADGQEIQARSQCWDRLVWTAPVTGRAETRGGVSTVKVQKVEAGGGGSEQRKRAYKLGAGRPQFKKPRAQREHREREQRRRKLQE